MSGFVGAAMSGGIVGGVINAALTSSIIFAAASVVLSIVYWVLYIVGGWKMYRKFGEGGWKSIIPLYNSWIEYKHTWNPFVAILTWVLYIVSSIMSSAAMVSMAYGVISPLAVVAMILGIIGWVIGIVGNYKLARAFGHGGGFTVGLVLLPGIFRIILGFGKSQYVGKAG